MLILYDDSRQWHGSGGAKLPLFVDVHGLDLASLVCADSTMSMGTFPILSHPFLIMTERSTTLLIYVVSFSLALVNYYDDANEVMNL